MFNGEIEAVNPCIGFIGRSLEPQQILDAAGETM